MIGRPVVIISSVALLAGAAAMADPPAAAGTDTVAKSRKADPNRMICRTLDGSGSRLERQRACHTAAEWAELRRETRASIDHIQNSRAYNQ